MTSVDLDEVVRTDDLALRPERARDFLFEYSMLQGFARQLAAGTSTVLQEMVSAAVRICAAGSAGVSLPESGPSGEPLLVWRAVAGDYARYLDGTLPIFSPCGVVIDRQRAALFVRPSLAFPYLSEVQPPICEALIVPLMAGPRVLGTIWIASHEDGGRFTTADLHVLEVLSDFTAAALMLKAHAQEARESAARERVERQRAEEAGRRKDEFLSVVSHELRTPLHAILSWSEMLLEGLYADERREAAASIHRNALRQARMVDDLLDSAGAALASPREQFTMLDLCAVADAALDALTPEARLKALAVRTRLPGPIPVAGDGPRLERAVANVIGNAIKFSEQDGSIDVDVSVEGAVAVLRVSDTGEGIAPDILPVVFERFRQGDASSSRRHAGLGLGLALARDIVAAHGGDIRAESHGRGCGATVFIRLPIAAPATASPAGPANEARLARVSARRHALLVDDNADARESMAVVLRYAGVSVDGVGSVREAIAAIEGRRPDIVLTDIAMPDEDGYALLSHLRAPGASPPAMASIPIVAVTAYGSAEMRARIRRAGFDACLVKPVSGRRLLQTVADIMAATPMTAR